MLKKRYKLSNGLAFFEELDMKKLSKMAAKGWHLKRFRFAGYELEKGDAEEVIYNIDYRTLPADEKDEYLELFAYGGWTHVCSSADMHIFKAAPGTTSIYSDAESAIDKLARLAKPVNIVASIMLAISMILWIWMKVSSGTLQHIAQQGFACSLIITVPALMTSGGVYYHMWKSLRLNFKNS